MSSYEKQNFQPGQILTAAQLNHIESYISLIDPSLEIIEEVDFVDQKVINFTKLTESNGLPYQFKEIVITVTGTFGEKVPSSSLIGARIEPDYNIAYDLCPREIDEELAGHKASSA